METFSALLAFCAGNSQVTDEFPAQRPVSRNFDVFFDLRLNGRLSKQSWCWWFETPLRSSWHRCNDIIWHNAAFLGNDSSGTHYRGIAIKIHTFYQWSRMPFKMLSVKCRWFYLGPNVMVKPCIGILTKVNTGIWYADNPESGSLTIQHLKNPVIAVRAYFPAGSQECGNGNWKISERDVIYRYIYILIRH